jgi:hypothetical protein
MLFIIGLLSGVAVGIVFEESIKPKVLAVYNAVKTAIKG